MAIASSKCSGLSKNRNCKEVQTPLCGHGLQSVLWASKTEKNKGRFFFRFSLSMGGKDCGYFRWVDEDLVDQDGMMSFVCNLVEMKSDVDLVAEKVEEIDCKLDEIRCEISVITKFFEKEWLKQKMDCEELKQLKQRSFVKFLLQILFHFIVVAIVGYLMIVVLM